MRCFASWDFSYGEQLAGASLRRRSTAPILSDGSAWGAAVASWHETGDFFAAHAAAGGSLNADYATMRERGLSPDPEDFVDQLMLVGSILDHYVSNSMRMESFGQIERELLVPVPARNGSGRDSSRYRYQCFIDGHHEYSGHPALAEFKLRETLTDVDVIRKQPQYRWYAWAYARVLDWDGPVSVVVDERLKAAPKPARIVKAKRKGEGIDGYTVSHAKDQVTTAEVYLEACAEYDAEPEPETVASLEARKWSSRVPLTFTPEQLAEAGRELVTGARLIAGLDTAAFYPIRNGSVQNCRGCRFKDICTEPDNDFVVDSLFERRPPKSKRP